ncbi:MAG: hypothetical protein U9O53_04910, partial [archaeon]|nr:hypothetical protein [archaeon]
MMRRGEMNIKVLLAVLIFVVVLSASLLLGGAQGEKVTRSVRDMNLPLTGSYCTGDAGDVPEDIFMDNVRESVKVAWRGKTACWVKQGAIDDEGNPVDIAYSDIYTNITDALDGPGAQGDDCLGGYFVNSTDGGTSQIDLVFWWDDKAICGIDGVITSTFSWVYGALGFSRDTFYFYPREDFCRGGTYVDWYNPQGNSNIYKYSDSKGRYNDAFICRDESGSGGDDLKLPIVEDLTGLSDAEAIQHMINETSVCVQSYKSDFNDGDTGGADIYLACEKAYLFSPSANTDIADVFPSDDAYYDDEDSFSYKTTACDILDDSLTDPVYGSYYSPDYSEFNSITWNRDTTGWHCLYIIVDRLVKTKDEIVNTDSDEANMLL